MKRKVEDMDPKPPAEIARLPAAPRCDERSITFNSMEEAEGIWKNKIWKWYLSYRLAEEDGVYLQILK